MFAQLTGTLKSFCLPFSYFKNTIPSVILIWIQSNGWEWGSIYISWCFVYVAFRNIFSYRNSKPQNDFKTAYQQIFSLLEFYQQIFSLLCLFLQISQWHVHWVISARGYMCRAQSFSCVWLFATPWTVACQVPLSMGFSRQEDWCGFPALLQGIFPTRRSNPGLPHCRWILYQVSHQESCGYKDPHQKIFL